MKATLSLPFGNCTISTKVTWSHPKAGQDHLSMQVFDTTSGHFFNPFTTQVGSADAAQDHDFFASAGGPDIWIAKAFLYDASNNVLAQTTSKRYTFNCTL